MEFKAIHDECEVIIIAIEIGNPKDCKEITIVYYDCSTGVIGFENGDETIFNNFVIIG
jgi:hypothetical protein